MTMLPLGQGEIRRQGRGVALLCFGSPLTACLEAAKGLNATVVNMRFVKPLDRQLVIDMALRHELLVTVEENTIQGGAGSAVAETLAEEGLTTHLLQLGLPDRFVDQGETSELLAECGLDAQGIQTAIEARLQQIHSNRTGTHTA
jgi:1-deoxy-D-xylulose-5-phosphate synthase